MRAPKALRPSLLPAAPEAIAADLLEGADEIAAFLGGKWNANRVYLAKHRGTLPIRTRPGMIVYAFKSELRTALVAPETLPARYAPPRVSRQ